MNVVLTNAPKLGVLATCAAFGVAPATYYRHVAPVHGPHRPRPSPARRLVEPERKAVLDVLHEPRFADLAPAEVFATLLEEGRYLCSIRTMQRILAESGELRERRDQLRHPAYAKPELLATAPNQLWSWDITKLRGPAKWTYYHLYVILDVFSRYVVGWMVAVKECQHLAAQLFAEAAARHQVEPGLRVHADRGSAMRSDTLAQLLATLGAMRSFSRPHVSDDNPFSEAQFKTLKYQPDYPGRFTGLLHARGWLESFFAWHNHGHQHSGLALFTPEDVFLGRVSTVHAVRQAALDAAYARHAERFPNGAPVAALPPTEVHINPLEARAVDRGAAVVQAEDLPSALDLRGPVTEKAAHTAARTPRREPLSTADFTLAP